jgi:fluoride exporter
MPARPSPEVANDKPHVRSSKDGAHAETDELIRYFLVLVGGGAGSLVRYVAASAIMTRFGGKFPLGTLVINVTGSFLIGFLMTLLTDRLKLDPNWRLLLVVGFLGGYTTFSSFEWETYAAVRDGAQWIALLNVVSSVMLGYVAVWLGVTLARR